MVELLAKRAKRMPMRRPRRLATNPPFKMSERGAIMARLATCRRRWRRERARRKPKQKAGPLIARCVLY